MVKVLNTREELEERVDNMFAVAVMVMMDWV